MKALKVVVMRDIVGKTFPQCYFQWSEASSWPDFKSL